MGVVGLCGLDCGGVRAGGGGGCGGVADWCGFSRCYSVVLQSLGFWACCPRGARLFPRVAKGVFMPTGLTAAVTTAATYFTTKGGGAVILVGTAIIGIAAGAVAFKWVKGMLFG